MSCDKFDEKRIPALTLEEFKRALDNMFDELAVEIINGTSTQKPKGVFTAKDSERDINSIPVPLPPDPRQLTREEILEMMTTPFQARRR